MSHALRSGPVPAERKCCDLGHVGGSGPVRLSASRGSGSLRLQASQAPGPVLKPHLLANGGSWSGAGALTNSVAVFVRHVSTGRVAFTRVSGAIQFDLRAPDPEQFLETIASSSDVSAALNSFNPQQPEYKALKAELAFARRSQDAEAAKAALNEKSSPERDRYAPDFRTVRPGTSSASLLGRTKATYLLGYCADSASNKCRATRRRCSISAGVTMLADILRLRSRLGSSRPRGRWLPASAYRPRHSV